MALINPYINFNSNAEKAFNFYKSVFGGEFTMFMCFKEISSPENTQWLACISNKTGKL